MIKMLLPHIPNILTLMRIILIFPILILLFGDAYSKFLSAMLLVFAGITDYLDGKIARKYNLESELGQFLDPLADKLIIISILLAFLQLDPSIFPYWMVWLIVSREFVVTALRIGGISQSSKVKTMFIGKVKTTAQFLTIFFIISLLILKDYLVEHGLIMKVQGAIGVPFNEIWFNYFGSWAYFLTYTPSFLLGISTILSVYSGIRYIMKNKQVISSLFVEDEL
ncbi:MAG: CDP-diacylglycerol--glycerol-3-phosphate 3-phosphatidyltransferase [Spirochaetae bacterium HGW-Spirochaetae-6]|nr:MAG: CDP-diacylglycerol--glycerol-3-phosphate 3-phosphatidyltransferase [Spirochaetae bacterium HGW-Spirochaetae-6]